MSPDTLPAGLYPAILTTLNRTTAPAYRLAAPPTSSGAGTARGYAGANPAAGVRLRLDAAGLALRQQNRPGELRIAPATTGRGDNMALVRSARPATASGEIRYDRGALAEWYRNGPLGLEQGFTLAVAPPGPAPRLAGGTLLLGTHGLRYTGLYAADAAGRHLPAHLTLVAAAGGWSLGLVMDDRGAHYPLAIDPNLHRSRQRLRQVRLISGDLGQRSEYSGPRNSDSGRGSG